MPDANAAQVPDQGQNGQDDDFVVVDRGLGGGGGRAAPPPHFPVKVERCRHGCRLQVNRDQKLAVPDRIRGTKRDHLRYLEAFMDDGCNLRALVHDALFFPLVIRRDLGIEVSFELEHWLGRMSQVLSSLQIHITHLKASQSPRSEGWTEQFGFWITLRWSTIAPTNPILKDMVANVIATYLMPGFHWHIGELRQHHAPGREQRAGHQPVPHVGAGQRQPAQVGGAAGLLDLSRHERGG